MHEHLICKVPETNHSYEIKIISSERESDVNLTNEITYFSAQTHKFAIITDTLVADLHAKKFTSDLLSLGLKAHLFSFPQGEKYKTRETKETLENQLFEKGFSKDTCIIAIGGGVVLDVSGYLSATFCRGVPLIMVPTTLLGMVDACIGGKNGVNVPYGKNLIGCIYPPKKVVIDLNFLQTLEKKELNNGIVEIIKHGLIADRILFEYVEENYEGIQAINPKMMKKIIFESCCIKKQIVEEDEKENGKRRLLNFGHTVGHALEKLSDYSLPHGKAVALGIIAESYLSMQMNELSQDSFDRIGKILNRYLPDLKESIAEINHRFHPDQILNAMALDKKSIDNRPRFVLLKEIGLASDFNQKYCTFAPNDLIIKALKEFTNDLYCHYRA